MNENNITRFEVSNFKKFDHLVVENIGQVNLITGDNNVGKTTLLEALLFNEDNLRWITYLHQLLFYRGIIFNIKNKNTKDILFPYDNFLSYILNDIEKPLVCEFTLPSGIQKEVALESRTIDTLTEEDFKYRKDSYDISNVADWVLFYKDKKIDELQWLYYDDMKVKASPVYWPYIEMVTPYGQDIRSFEKGLNVSSNGVGKEKVEFNYFDKKSVIEHLKLFIGEIVDYDYLPFGNDELHAIATSKDGKYRPVTTFGDSVQKFFRYVMTILYANKIGDPRLMIDEVDAGVHYLKMKDEWKAIFQLSKQTGVQIFATTHSSDCIKAFVEAGEEDNEWREKIRLIELTEANVKGKDKMYANTYTVDDINSAIDSGLNIRGGRIYGKY